MTWSANIVTSNTLVTSGCLVNQGRDFWKKYFDNLWRLYHKFWEAIIFIDGFFIMQIFVKLQKILKRQVFVNYKIFLGVAMNFLKNVIIGICRIFVELICWTSHLFQFLWYNKVRCWNWAITSLNEQFFVKNQIVFNLS